MHPAGGSRYRAPDRSALADGFLGSRPTITAGTFGLNNEGWIDPYGLLQAFRRKARALGAVYAKDES